MIGSRHERDVFRARQRIIHERARDRLAAGVVIHFLHQRLADALRHAAVPLAMTSAEDSTMACPVAVIEREPPVPLPKRTRSLSFCSSVIFSKGTPSCADSTCANGVAWPWP